MPTGQYVAMGVYVDKKKLPEYQIKDKIYTEVDLHGPTSYIVEEDGQKYPVLPFEISIQLTAPFVVWVTVYVDGQTVSSRPLKHTCWCNGVKVGDEIRELLFSLPRMVEDQEQQNPLGDYAGTLRAVVKRATCTGEKCLPVFKHHAPLHTSSYGPALHHLTKKDVQRSQKHAVGGIVSRDGRPVMGLTKTNKVRRAKYFIPTNDVLEEVVLYYRPRIYSHTPAPIASDPIPEAAAELQHQPQTGTERRPLGDVGNRPLQPPATKDSADALKLIQEANHARSRFSATPSDTSDTEQWLSAANIKRRDSCAAGLVPPPNQTLESLEPLSPEDVDVKLHESGLIPTDQIKRRESGMISMDQIKRRESDIVTTAQSKGQESKIIQADQIQRRESGVIPINQIKRRESGMIPINKVKRRESGMILMDEVKRRESGMILMDEVKRRESGMILMDEVKRRESGMILMDEVKRRESGMILMDEVKRRESGMILMDEVKRRESGMILMDEVKHQEDSSGLIPPGKIKRRESCLPTVFSVGEQGEETGEGDRSFIIIDDTDDEDDDIYIVECQDDSVVYMGDDDCCVMDVSNNISLVELDMTIDSMDQLNLE